MTEFKLSDKKIDAREFIESESDNLEEYPKGEFYIYPENNIKEFIRRLKEELDMNILRFKTIEDAWDLIDKLAGDLK